MARKLPRIQPGDELKAYHINDPNEELERIGINIGANSSLGYSEGPNGTTIWGIQSVEFWAKITSGGGGTDGSSGPYAWKEQIPQPGGTWLDGYREGTTSLLPAYETTANPSVTANKIVWMRLSESANTFLFSYRKCS